MITRERAIEILHEHTKSESLRRHAIQVETCVAAWAVKFTADPETWSVTAMLHDFDYEMHPGWA
jgi:predicted hydrolase (HD superfamily)